MRKYFKIKMSLIPKINKYWNYLEQKYPTPKYVGKVKDLKFEDLKNFFNK